MQNRRRQNAQIKLSRRVFYRAGRYMIMYKGCLKPVNQILNTQATFGKLALSAAQYAADNGHEYLSDFHFLVPIATSFPHEPAAQGLLTNASAETIGLALKKLVHTEPSINAP